MDKKFYKTLNVILTISIGIVFLTFIKVNNPQITELTTPVVLKGHKVKELDRWDGENVKLAYLTFDDGPTQYSKEILDTLDKYDVKATFFFTGVQVEKYPEVVKDVYQRGHTVGLHSYDHKKETLYYTDDKQAFVKSMEHTHELVNQAVGEEIEVVITRPPYGSAPFFNDADLSRSVIDSPYKIWDWTIDSNDWQYGIRPEYVANSIIREANSNFEIILMHEFVTTAAALEIVIPTLIEEGYSFASYDNNGHIPMNLVGDPRL